MYMDEPYGALQSVRRAVRRAEDMQRLRATLTAAPSIPSRPQNRRPPPPKYAALPHTNSLDFGLGPEHQGMAWKMQSMRHHGGFSSRTEKYAARPLPARQQPPHSPPATGRSRSKSENAGPCLTDISYGALKSRLAGPSPAYRSQMPHGTGHIRENVLSIH